MIMRSASQSLGSLSSPSLSPSPPLPEAAEHALSQAAATGAVGLDSGSELSELTEEEQDTENHSNDENEDGGDEGEVKGSRRRPVRRGERRRKRGGIVPAAMWEWAYKPKKNADKGTTAPEEEEEEEVAGPPEAMEEEEGDSRRTSMHPSFDENSLEGEEEDEDEVRSHRGYLLAPPRGSQKRLVPISGRRILSEDEDEDEEDEDEDEDAEVEEDCDVPRLRLDPADPNNDSESDPDVDPIESATVPESSAPMDAEIVENIDITAPPLETIMPIAAAAAATSSITAGSSVLVPVTSTPDSSLSGSPSSSRSASPLPDKADEEEEDEEDEEATPSGRILVNKTFSKDEDAGPLESVSSTIDSTKQSAKEADAEDVEAASVLHDEIDMEIDADLQPAHRAEALDVLATIELKFALLRERVYVEKMEGLAWEEALVAEGLFFLI